MASNYWLKLYYEVIDDPKVALLPDHLWRRFFELCILAGETDKGGAIPTPKQTAWRLRVPVSQFCQELQDLEAAALMTYVDDSWIVTNFSKRQAAVSGKERVKRHREAKKKRNQKHEGNSDVTKRYTDIDKIEDKIEDKDKIRYPAVPFELASPPFLNVWGEWLQHHEEKTRPLTFTACNRQLQNLSRAGTERAIQVLAYSLDNNYVGLFFDFDSKVKKNGNLSGNGRPQSGMEKAASELYDLILEEQGE